MQMAKAIPSSGPETVRLEPIGGAVPLDSRFYVERASDALFINALKAHESIVLVKGPRQVGKTSLLARGLQAARSAGTKILLTDFQKLNSSALDSADAFYKTMGLAIADKLDLDPPEKNWDEGRSASSNFERFFTRALHEIGTNCVWAMDEVDRVFGTDYASDFFALLRSWSNERSLDPGSPFGGLSVAVSYATEAHLFISDVNMSPFNVGTRITLEDFTIEQVADLNDRHGSPLSGSGELTRFYAFLHGHPFLVRRAFNELVSQGISLDEFEAQAERDDGFFGDHLRRILVLLAKDAGLRAVVRDVTNGKAAPDRESFNRLKSAGLIRGLAPEDFRMRCGLYQRFLQRHLGE